MEKKFLRYVRKEASCWRWMGQIDVRGFGHMGHDLAHRVAWQIYKGTIPPGKCVLHTCGHPECVNPEHLYLGTSKESIKASIKENRFGKRTRVLITEDQVKEICELYMTGTDPHQLAEQFSIPVETLNSQILRYIEREVI